MSLYVYRWQGRPVFLRLAEPDARPPCPQLYDEVFEIPVAQPDAPPPSRQMRWTPLVADWLAPVFD